GAVYVVVLPESASREAGGDATETLRAIAVKLHRRGTYAGVIGSHFRALSNVLPAGEAGKLANEAIAAPRPPTPPPPTAPPASPPPSSTSSTASRTRVTEPTAATTPASRTGG